MSENDHVCVKEVQLAQMQWTCDDTNRKTDATAKKVDELITLLKGNGKIGLVEEVHKQADFCQSIQKKREYDKKKNDGFWQRFVAPIYNVVVVSVLTLLLVGLIAFMQTKNEASRVDKLDTIIQQLNSMSK